MMKLTTIYERGDTWYFEPYSRAITGLWVATPPLLRLDKDASAKHKYEAAMEALNSSQEGIPLPSDEEDPSAPFLAMAKTNSWAAFMKTSRVIDVELHNGRLTITPQRRLRRPAGALEPISERALDLPADASPEEIVKAMDEAMSRFQ